MTWSIAFAAVVVAGLALYHGFNLVTIALAAVEMRRQRWMTSHPAVRALEEGRLLPGVAVIVPAYNEQVSIVRTVHSILRLAYADLQVIVVSDGSTDGTLQALTRAFALRPSLDAPSGTLSTQSVRAVFSSAVDARLVVVDKRNGGKADALNVGINIARTPLVLAVDADIALDRKALLHLTMPFVLYPDTVATSGVIRPSNGCVRRRERIVRGEVPGHLLEAFQVLEYMRAYGVGRLFFNRFNGHLIISGAFGLFDRELLLEIGGYQTHAVGEDIELVARIHRHLVAQQRPYRLEFSSHALCFTEAPHSLPDLGKQRLRWHQGLLSTLRIHRAMALNRRFGWIGLLTVPYFVLELAAPALEALGWLVLPALWWTGALPPAMLALFVAVGVLMSTSVSLAAILLDALQFNHFRRSIDRARLIACALLEHIGYRQCTIYYRLKGIVRYYSSIHLKSSWKSPTRAAQAAP